MSDKRDAATDGKDNAKQRVGWMLMVRDGWRGRVDECLDVAGLWRRMWMSGRRYKGEAVLMRSKGKERG